MSKALISRPSDPYSPDWELYWQQNPGLHRGAGAEAAAATEEGGAETADAGAAGADVGDAAAGSSPTTIIEEPSTDVPDSAVPGTWPDDWRSQFSPDGKHVKTLERFASPKAVFESYMALRQKQDSGELKPVVEFPEKGTDEEKSAWRKDHGIPEAPEDYSKSLGDLVIGDDDKSIFDDFFAKMHERNMPTSLAKEVVGWYYDYQDAFQEQQETQDNDYLTSSEDTLRAEWGGDYRRNINLIKGLYDTMPETLQIQFQDSRGGDGNRLLNDPEMARWLVNIARQVNPVTTVVPGAGANAAQAIEEEIKQIETLMRTDRAAYNKDMQMQARLRDLYDARARAGKG